MILLLIISGLITNQMLVEFEKKSRIMFDRKDYIRRTHQLKHAFKVFIR
jgi:hypothetical protein